MIASTVAPAFAAQMEFRTWVESGSVDEVEIKFQRTIIINYDEGGMLADELRGQKFAKTFTVTSSDPGVNELRDRINYQLSQAGSSAAVTDVQLDYDTKLTGRGLNTSIDYKVILTLDLSNHILRESSSGNSGLVDMNWRGLLVPTPPATRCMDVRARSASVRGEVVKGLIRYSCPEQEEERHAHKNHGPAGSRGSSDLDFSR